jgi:hypothetical protein
MAETSFPMGRRLLPMVAATAVICVWSSSSVLTARYSGLAAVSLGSEYSLD